MNPASRSRATIEVLQWRERKRRLALAQLSQAIEKERRGIEAAQALIATVRDHMQAGLNARFTEGPRCVSALQELETHTRNLRTRGEELLNLKRQAERVLEDLLTQRQAGARLWRRSEAALEHVQSLARRERTLREIRQFESEIDEWRPLPAPGSLR
jgi:hypothetical protein